jgi:regulator of protease activity HflC (stomatin/prohibitin superfamily)
MLSNEKDRTMVFDCIKEMSNSMARVDAEKEFQKEAAEALTDKVEIDKKHINALAKIYHKQNFATFQQQREEIEDLYESVVK